MSPTPPRYTGALHDLKTWPEYFAPLASGRKTFEVRRNDRDFRVGDILNLREFDPLNTEGGQAGRYTGASVECRVSYVLAGGQFGIDPAYVVLGLEGVEDTLCQKQARVLDRLREWVNEYPNDRYTGQFWADDLARLLREEGVTP